MKRMVVIILSVIALIIILSNKALPAIKEVFAMTGISSNGRIVSFTFPELFTLQMPPPKLRLKSYMSRKYGIKFTEYKGDEFLNERDNMYHTSAEGFDLYCNGILVSTAEYPDHYFYVRNEYGTYIDDYLLHVKHSDMEEYLCNTFDSVICEEYKVVCIPMWDQEAELSTEWSTEELLKNGRYETRIYISEKADIRSAENDEKLTGNIKEAFDPYWRMYNFLGIYYVSNEVLASIDPDKLVFGAANDSEIECERIYYQRKL